MNILGLNYWFHDSSACIISDGRIVVALEEERFTRQKHTREFPHQAIAQCLKTANLALSDIDHVAVSIKPTHCWLKKTRYALRAPHRAWPFIRHELITGFFKQQKFKQWVNSAWPDATQRPKLHPIEHHLSHAAGSYFASPYEHAAIMSLDGSGEWACAWLGEGHGNQVTRLGDTAFPHSLGSVYESVTEFCGFRPNYDEGKTMGLAPLGNAERFIDQARACVQISDAGQIRVDLRYFSYQYWGFKRCSPLFYETFGEPRQPDGPFLPHHQDVAAAFQQVLEECALHIARMLKRRTQAPYLVIAGGVALNSVMNGRLLREAGFKDVYIMPAAGDNGTSIGAALTLNTMVLQQDRNTAHNDPYLGNAYDDESIRALLDAFKLRYTESDDIAADTAQLLAQGHIVGWFQGRMEIGPRALGARSILANPAFPNMKDKINAEVKYREAYRPFAPSATVEASREFFDIEVEAPFMLKVCQVKPEKQALLPAITHVDGSARLQTVSRTINPLYHRLIDQLGEQTGVPVVLNTSFNIQGEPVVESPRDAIRCFFSTGLDTLAIGRFLISK